MSTRVAINGFGRIGRAVLRAAIERDAELDVIAVNDIADADTLAHLLTLDSVTGASRPGPRPRAGRREHRARRQLRPGL